MPPAGLARWLPLLLLLTTCGGGGGSVEPRVPLLAVQGVASFGDVVVGDAAPTKTWTISNQGDEDLTVDDVRLAGAAAASFTVAASVWPQVLVPGSTLQCELGFTPMAEGSVAADVEIVSNDGGVAGTSRRILVQGVGVPPPPIHFVDATLEAGLLAAHAGGARAGQAFADVNGDGWLDLYVTDSDGPDTLYVNQGDGTFLPAPQVFDTPNTSAAVFADYDNDGDPDLYVADAGQDHLYRNDGGVLVDVALEAGLGEVNVADGRAAAFGDYDGDGDLDLYVGNHSGFGPDVFYRNEGDGTFTDVTSLLAPTPLGLCFAVSFVDYDNDGDLDLYVTNDRLGIEEARPWFRRNLLYRNDGPGSGGWVFTEVAESVGADLWIDAMGLAIADYDLDGDLDMALSDTEDQALLRNEGDGTFIEVADASGIGRPGIFWGTVFADFDLDGWPDLYMATNTERNGCWRNLGDGTFEDVSEASGAADPLASYGVAYADYDNDGDVDLVVCNGGTGYRLYRNTADPGTRWVGVRLVGGGPVNTSAIGARVTLELSDGRSILQEVKSGSSMGSGNDLGLRFGLGDAEPVRLRVRWPDGLVEERAPVPQGAEILWSYPAP